MRDPIVRENSRRRDVAYKRATRAFFARNECGRVIGLTARNPYPVRTLLEHDAFEDRLLALQDKANAACRAVLYARSLVA